MPRTVTIIAAAVAGLAVLGWYGRRRAGRWVYAGIRIGQAVEQERQRTTEQVV